MGSSLRVREVVVVAPSASTPSDVLQLSALDSQLFLRFTIEYLLLFRSCPGLDLAATSAALKSALARALVPYYPLAGRVRARHDGSCLEVVCRAQGALFIEAFTDRFSLGDFQDKAPKTVTQWRKFLSFPVADVLKGSPPLVVQLTWLRDGSAAVGIGINHCICDGIGSADFLNHFAELARSSVLADPLKPALKPVWDRHLLTSPSMNTTEATNTTILPEFNRVPDLCGFMTRVSSDLKPTSITFDKSHLDQLKSIALDTSRLGESSFTSFEVLAAHVWRSWARALNFPANQTLKLLFSINVRNRLKPGLPDGYYGNAFVLGCAQSSAKELEEKGIGYGSGLVKKAKERVDNDYVRRVVELVSESRACPDSVGVLIVSQWSRLGLDRVDFGMGKPMNVGPICCDRYCLFLPVKDQSDAVKVMVAVPTSAVDDYIHSLTLH
ncbi:taxadien-5-alpha-ol O-acetyltransferase-like [Neltuma alba]|uniref:taxadien-5-alpha-ol O-acetyltransferase-like n=1 Tax=Neltuma alba TaxID=207710 RepID=UPI0010A4FD13|nr:taxadien-5-alpha-ol O-acetyltransferase-like [Prosopis alba]